MILFKYSIRTAIFSAVILVIILTAVTVLTVKFDIEGDFEGVYLLKGTDSKLLEIKDDVLLGEYDRVFFKKDLPWLHALIDRDQQVNIDEPYLKLSWNSKAGHGFIYSHSPDGTRFVICLSRFLDSKNKAPQGLFIGGGLPYSRYESSTVQLNETGMAHFDGQTWHHIWCNANEAIAGGNSPGKMIFPSDWEFLGSSVHYDTAKKTMLQSSHRVFIDGVPFRIDRYIIYRAGDTYLLMINRFTNIGDKPSSYFFVYGDEPWVGNYGSSGGNVGWTEDRLYYFESIVNPYNHSYAGMYDLGNPVVMGENKTYSGLANFIEWIGDIRPDLVYFSNKEGKTSDESQRVPLASRDNRVIFLQWGPRMLGPKQTETFIMAIGMAKSPRNVRLPVKPDIRIDRSDMQFIMSRN